MSNPTWFGDDWDSPWIQHNPGTQGDVPILTDCTACKQLIGPDDYGFFQGKHRGMHLHCWLKANFPSHTPEQVLKVAAKWGGNHLIEAMARLGWDVPEEPKVEEAENVQPVPIPKGKVYRGVT